MPKKPRIPTYRRHKASGQAVVVLQGTSVYLGKWNSPESHAEYARVIGEWLANAKRLPGTEQSPPQAGIAATQPSLTVSELMLDF